MALLDRPRAFASALQIELWDEEKRLSEVKPFQPMLRVVDKPGNKDEKIMNSNIGYLISKGSAKIQVTVIIRIFDAQRHFFLHKKKTTKKTKKKNILQKFEGVFLSRARL